MSKLKNVVIVNDFDYTQGGASKVAIETANILISNNSDLNVYFFSGCHSDTSNLSSNVINVCTNQGETLKDKNKIRGIINGIYNFKAKREFKRLLKMLNKDETIIHVHGWTKSLSSSVFDIAFKMGYNVVLTMHDYFTACPNGGYYNYKKNEICYLKPMCLKCMKCNCDSRNYLFKLYRILRQFMYNNSFKKLKNVIAISDFSYNILKRTLNKNVRVFRANNPIDHAETLYNNDFNKDSYYINVSRISQEKGVDIFCEAIRRTGVKGVVVGDGPQKSLLEKEYPEVDFVGWKNSDEVKKYMASAKCLVFTSRLYEVSPLTTMEALLMNLPCIVWSGCAASDHIVNGVNGFLFDDIDSLCRIIKNNTLPKFNYVYNNNYYSDIIKHYKDIIGCDNGD